MTNNKDFWDNTLEHCSKKDKDYIASVLCKQIIYERDLAIQQLKDLGYGLGEKPKENKGEWIDNGNGSYTCSNCKTEWTTSQIEKMCFCPTCGADMRPEPYKKGE